MKKAYLLLGSNSGNRRQNLLDALQHIENYAGKVIKSSSVYETAPWGNPDQQNFFNQAVLIETHMEPTILLHELLAIERLLGRKRGENEAEKWAQRIIDIDILFYNNDTLQTEQLTIPHPRLHERNFALKPMLELAPDHKHPVTGKNIEHLAKNCTDTLSVTKIN
ncbi:MAG: 2-amino-4-hydroxy-6-hydroxymethyldihydropteridine diphosphokinase [Bacteroidia bacterium]|nr:2-amino-4-hydroxy-6-hydroxymethyldihydropteridine diphosphokinase [Bacteroidia bacterium]